MSKDKPYEYSKGVRGRSRGREKSPKEMELEDRAKGHAHLDTDEGNSDQTNEERSSTPKVRGNQKGFGKNQGKEAGDRTAPHGTRPEGSEHG